MPTVADMPMADTTTRFLKSTWALYPISDHIPTKMSSHPHFTSTKKKKNHTMIPNVVQSLYGAQSNILTQATATITFWSYFTRLLLLRRWSHSPVLDLYSRTEKCLLLWRNAHLQCQVQHVTVMLRMICWEVRKRRFDSIMKSLPK